MATEALTDGAVLVVDVDDVRPNEWNPNQLTEQEFGQFCDEVRRLGRLPKPIVARPINDGAFEIVDGEQGWSAAKANGLAEVPVEVSIADTYEAMRQTLTRNRHGVHNRVLQGRVYEAMLSERGLTPAQLAEDLGVSETTVRNDLAYAEASRRRGESNEEIRGRAPTGQSASLRISDLKVRQVHRYLRLPRGIDDRWLESGADLKVVDAPLTVRRRVKGRYVRRAYGPAELTAGLDELHATGIGDLVQAGRSFATSLQNALTVLEWRRAMSRHVGGATLDAYLRPVRTLAQDDRLDDLEMLLR
jgi:hypothetical protein